MIVASRSPRSPLVGRDHECTIAQARLAQAAAGRGCLVLISGEAGVGKTALADLLVHEAEDTGALALIGHCYDRTETPPYGPWLELLRSFRAATPPVPRLDTATSQAALFAAGA